MATVLNREDRPGERGMALIVVLWTLLLIGIVATSLTTSARKEGLLGRNGVFAARVEAAADGGIMQAVAALQDSRLDMRWAADGQPHQFMLDSVMVSVRVLDEAGKIDVNTASPDLIAIAFEAAGASPVLATHLAAEIFRFRSGRSGEAPHGFEVPSEVLTVQGMPPALFERAAPFLTVLTRSPGIDTSVARPELVSALRGETRDAGREAVAPLSATTATAQNTVHTLFTIEATATEGPAVYVRRAIVRVTHNVLLPVLIHEWTRASDGR